MEVNMDYFGVFAVGFILGIATVILLAWLGIRMMDKPMKDYEAEKKKLKHQQTKIDIGV